VAAREVRGADGQAGEGQADALPAAPGRTAAEQLAHQGLALGLRHALLDQVGRGIRDGRAEAGDLLVAGGGIDAITGVSAAILTIASLKRAPGSRDSSLAWSPVVTQAWTVPPPSAPAPPALAPGAASASSVAIAPRRRISCVIDIVRISSS
jgi:hypothetical protein